MKITRCHWFGHDWYYIEPHAALGLGFWWEVRCNRCGKEDTYQCYSIKQWFDIGYIKITDDLLDSLSRDTQ